MAETATNLPEALLTAIQESSELLIKTIETASSHPIDEKTDALSMRSFLIKIGIVSAELSTRLEDYMALMAMHPDLFSEATEIGFKADEK